MNGAHDVLSLKPSVLVKKLIDIAFSVANRHKLHFLLQPLSHPTKCPNPLKTLLPLDWLVSSADRSSFCLRGAGPNLRVQQPQRQPLGGNRKTAMGNQALATRLATGRTD